MAKATVTILCPSGHRRKAQMNPNSNLLTVLEDMCIQEQLDSSEWGLIHQRKKCDLALPWRLSGIPTNATLEMIKLDKPRAVSNITVQLQLPDNTRLIGTFQPSTSLHEMLEWYRQQADNNALRDFDESNSIEQLSNPVCSYMSEEIIGTFALSNTTLRELGLTEGAAVIRFHYRSINEEDLRKITDRINEKLARRTQRSAQQSQVSATPMETSVAKIELPPMTLNTMTTPLFPTNEYSIFREPPVSLPRATEKKTTTLAESLGIRISFDSQPSIDLRQPDFSDFKFPEATKGANLLEKDNESNSSANRNLKSCERHALAYDLNKTNSSSTNQADELPDSFFELTADDLRSVLHTLRQQSTEENPLETRAMRDRFQSVRTVQYEHVVIRVVCNSNLILQGLFLPHEPVSNLVEFIRRHLRSPHLNESGFYLYTRPPKVILSDSKKTLAAYDLAPAAYVYLAHRTVSPLIVELDSSVPIDTIEKANDLVAKQVYNRAQPLVVDEHSATTQSTLPTRTTTTMTNDPTSSSSKRVASVNSVDNQYLKDKMRKFLPGSK